MSFEIRSKDVDVEAIMRAIRKRIDEKRQGLYTDEEIREIADHRLDAVLDAHEFNSDFIKDFRSDPGQWNFSLCAAHRVPDSPVGWPGPGPDHPILRPSRLFWNPTDYSALSRQRSQRYSYTSSTTSRSISLNDLGCRTSRTATSVPAASSSSRAARRLREMLSIRPRAECRAARDRGAP